MRRMLAALVTATALVAAPTPVWAQEGDAGDEDSGGSLVELVLRSADETLGADATVAVVRAYDRGYEVVQIIEALLDGLMSTDGTITDDEGVSLPPFRAPSGVLAGDGAAATGGPVGGSSRRAGPTSGEEIGLDVLERGVQKTTKQLDKKVDLGKRASQAGVSNESLFTMLATIFLMAEGYSPEQIIVDGFLAGGIELVSPVDGLVIVDEKGKRIRPAGVEASDEQEESAGAIDAFAVDVVEMVAGLDVRTAAGESFKDQFTVDVEITVSGEVPFTITGKGRLGQPRDKRLRTFVVGNGDGRLDYSNECSISGIGGAHPYRVSGNVVFGFSGPIDNGGTRLHVGITEANVSVSGDDSLCVDIVRDTAGALEAIGLPPVELRFRDGATGVGEGSFGTEPLEVRVTINT